MISPNQYFITLEDILMQTTKIDENHFELTLAEQELAVIMDCIRESFLELEGEFATRTGLLESEVMKLLDQLKLLLDKAGIKY